MFNDTIGYNIAYGKLGASACQVKEAARAAQIHDSVSKLPLGYRTLVGERGLKLSGGEKQRVSIARAVLKNAPILLCDEATSALDTKTEINIMNEIKEIGQNKTTILVAHRLSTIQDADEILVMDKGEGRERREIEGRSCCSTSYVNAIFRRVGSVEAFACRFLTVHPLTYPVVSGQANACYP